ncbi:hypothetical protein EST38_g14404, partial [Candolleomyces aberdarensis]
VCFDAALGVKKWSKNLDTPIGHVSLSRNGKLSLVDNLCTGFDLYDAAELCLKQSFELPGKPNHVKDATFVEDGSTVACPDEGGYIYIFNNNASKPIEVLRHAQGGVRRVAVSIIFMESSRPNVLTPSI